MRRRCSIPCSRLTHTRSKRSSLTWALLGAVASVPVLAAGCSGGSDPCAGYLVDLDAFESDDEPEAAAVLAPGTDQDRTIHCAAGKLNDDFIVLETEPGKVYARPLIETSEGEEPSLKVIDPSGAESGYFAEHGSNSAWLAPASGRYTLRLSAASDWNVLLGEMTFYTARYRVRFDEITGDAYEPDDTLATAGDIASGEMQERTLTYYGDVDTIRISVTAGTQVNVFVPLDQRSGEIEPIVSILDGAENDVSAGTPNWDVSSGGFWTAPSDGSFYVTFANDSTASRFVGPETYKIAIDNPF